MTAYLLHPLTTFIAGALLSLVLLGVILKSSTEPNSSEDLVKTYEKAMAQAGEQGPAPGTPEEAAAITTFTDFLKNVGNKDYIKQNTAKAYAPEAYLDDTIVTHYGPEEIKKYFLATAETMTGFEVRILDQARSGPDHYIRWKMIFSAPKLGGGTPIHSVGMSQVRFNEDGQVAFHQDFWDSGKNIYGQIPIVGGFISIIRNRMK
ncbi:MAG: nuclear transport factor 2 family protein [Akkermansiaceae bacterium]|jgi:hypothetical protein